MRLTGISLQHFRSYTQKTFHFPQQITVVLGKNATGKTSIIEAIQLLATGESFRATQVEEMITFDAELGRVKGKVIETAEAEPERGSEHSTDLEVTLTRGEVQGRRTSARLYAVNDVRRLKKNFVGNFFTVVFRPEDLRLIEGSPSRRREFIDTVLCMVHPHYAVALKTYQQALLRRNRLLEQVREGETSQNTLTYWTALIVKHGRVLQEQRRQFFAFFLDVPFMTTFTLTYQPSLLSDERLAQYAGREIAAGHTLIGPHKDDFMVSLKEKNVAVYGSRGQQRLAVLWLKICEFAYIKEVAQHQPVLLLDDILSELDAEHREEVFALLQSGQSILTTTEEKMVNELRHVVSTIDLISL